MRRLAFVVPTLIALIIACGACKRTGACREVCPKLGIDAASDQCTQLCTRDCDELAQTFGIAVEKCTAIQHGTL